MRNILTIIIALVLIGVPCGTHAAQTDWSNLDSGLIVRTAIQANDTELYSILSGTTPTLGPIIIGGTGDSWLELQNNTSLVDDITGKYGIRFSNGVLQQIINGTPSSIGSGGSAVTTQVADPTVGDPTGFYLSTGTTKFWYRDSTLGTYDFGTYAFTADPIIPVVSGVTIDGTALAITYDVNVTQGTGYTATDLNIDGATMGADVALTYVSGNTTAIHNYTSATAAIESEVINLDFLGRVDGLESSTGDDLVAFTDQAVVNNTASLYTDVTGHVNANGTVAVTTYTLDSTETGPATALIVSQADVVADATMVGLNVFDLSTTGDAIAFDVTQAADKFQYAFLIRTPVTPVTDTTPFYGFYNDSTVRMARVGFEVGATTELSLLYRDNAGSYVSVTTTGASLAGNTVYIAQVIIDDSVPSRKLNVYNAAGTLLIDFAEDTAAFTPPTAGYTTFTIGSSANVGVRVDNPMWSNGSVVRDFVNDEIGGNKMILIDTTPNP